jgi:hypothetical protein
VPGRRRAYATWAVEGLPADLVCAGSSLGVLAAQLLARTRPGAAAAALLTERVLALLAAR